MPGIKLPSENSAQANQVIILGLLSLQKIIHLKYSLISKV